MNSAFPKVTPYAACAVVTNQGEPVYVEGQENFEFEAHSLIASEIFARRKTLNRQLHRRLLHRHSELMSLQLSHRSAGTDQQPKNNETPSPRLPRRIVPAKTLRPPRSQIPTHRLKSPRAHEMSLSLISQWTFISKMSEVICKSSRRIRHLFLRRSGPFRCVSGAIWKLLKLITNRFRILS